MNSENKKLDFTEAVNEYADMAYRLSLRVLGNRQDAEDAVQLSFVKLYRNRKEFKREKNLKNWIYTITYNTCRDMYRKNKRRAESVIIEEDIIDKDTYELGTAEMENRVEKYLSLLSEPQRKIVTMHYIEERKVTDIAEALEMSESNVKISLFRARKKILEKNQGA